MMSGESHRRRSMSKWGVCVLVWVYSKKSTVRKRWAGRHFGGRTQRVPSAAQGCCPPPTTRSAHLHEAHSHAAQARQRLHQRLDGDARQGLELRRAQWSRHSVHGGVRWACACRASCSGTVQHPSWPARHHHTGTHAWMLATSTGTSMVLGPALTTAVTRTVMSPPQNAGACGGAQATVGPPGPRREAQQAPGQRSAAAGGCSRQRVLRRAPHLDDQLVLVGLEGLEAVDARRAAAQVQAVDADRLEHLGLKGGGGGSQ